MKKINPGNARPKLYSYHRDASSLTRVKYSNGDKINEVKIAPWGGDGQLYSGVMYSWKNMPTAIPKIAGARMCLNPVSKSKPLGRSKSESLEELA